MTDSEIDVMITNTEIEKLIRFIIESKETSITDKDLIEYILYKLENLKVNYKVNNYEVKIEDNEWSKSPFIHWINNNIVLDSDKCVTVDNIKNLFDKFAPNENLKLLTRKEIIKALKSQGFVYDRFRMIYGSRGCFRGFYFKNLDNIETTS